MQMLQFEVTPISVLVLRHGDFLPKTFKIILCFCTVADSRMTALGGYLMLEVYLKCLDCGNLYCIETLLFTVQFLQLNSCLIRKKKRKKQTH